MIRKVKKQADYWLFCPKCEKYRNLESLEEKPWTTDCSYLLCPCGHEFFGIEKVWTYFDERPAQFESKAAKATHP